jgi:hypothetical protein
MFVTLLVLMGGQVQRTALNTDNIVSVDESADRRCQLHLTDNSVMTVRMSLNEVVDMLNRAGAATASRPTGAQLSWPVPVSANDPEGTHHETHN